MKKCGGPCGLEKHLDEFGACKANADGKRHTCKACINDQQRRRARAEVTPPEATLRAWEAYGTPFQKTTVEAILAHGSIAAAAEALGMSAKALHGHLHELERAAAKRGWLPGDGPIEAVPPGFHVKGTSTMYGPEGEVKLRWVKTRNDEEAKLERLLAAMPQVFEPFKGAADPAAAPDVSDDDLLCWYPFGDPHLGMHAWGLEAGENFDLEIAERELVAAADRLVYVAPPARQAVVCSLGDFFHSDNKSSTTTKGTMVDTDTRWPKVLAVGIRAMRRIIDRALEKHAEVRVICASGNHDDLTSLALSLCLANFYEREPRVSVDVSPAKFRWHRFGANLIGVAHGDTAKRDELGAIMACDQAKAWGETQHRYWYTGHIHHETVKEYPGCVVESFRTLAPKDAYHAAAGYRSGQDMRVHVIHREWGRINEHHVGIQQVRAKKERP